MTSRNPCSSYFTHRAIGRASSPPTWMCWEVEPCFEDDDDDDEDDEDDEDEYTDIGSDGSCSDDEDRPRPASLRPVPPDHTDSDDNADYFLAHSATADERRGDDPHLMDIDDDSQRCDRGIDAALPPVPPSPPPHDRDIKGKQRAIRPLRLHRRRRGSLFLVVCIGTSQGFVWNLVRLSFRPSSRPLTIAQDLFAPPGYGRHQCLSLSPTPLPSSVLTPSFSRRRIYLALSLPLTTHPRLVSAPRGRRDPRKG